MTLPRGPEGTLGGVLPAAALAIGVDHESHHHADLGLGHVRSVCVVLVDGLGDVQLAEHIGHAPFLRSMRSRTTVLQSAFPSTTATSLGLLGTGRGPGKTGLTGYSVRDPASGSVSSLLAWQLADRPEDWQRYPTVFESVTAAGSDAVFIGEPKFDGSGFTRAALRGAQFVAARGLDERVDATLRVLSRPTSALVYLYWGQLDKVGHIRGVHSIEWTAELEACDVELGRLARRLPRDCALVVTADHGMVDVDHSLRVDLAERPDLADDVAVMAGDHRAAHLYLSTFGMAGEVEAQNLSLKWKSRLGRPAWIATRREAVEAGWFGAVDEAVLPLLGDVIVAPRERFAIVDSRFHTAAAVGLTGVHGSLTPDETHVPCVVVSERNHDG